MIAVLGWVGSFLYLINHSYISVVRNWNPKIYYTGNLIAAVFLVISSIIVISYQAAVINTFWAVISVLLLLNVDVKKIPLSRRAFNVGFIILLIWLAFSAVQLSWSSPVFHANLGWSSSYVFCLSYFLFSSKKLSQRKYLLFNVYAACALLPTLWNQENWPVFSLEICWALISAYGMLSRQEPLHLID